jgi:hypothetical protein
MPSKHLLSPPYPIVYWDLRSFETLPIEPQTTFHVFLCTLLVKCCHFSPCGPWII